MESSLRGIVEPWYQALKDPAQAQSQVLEELLAGYRKTAYGKTRGADEITILSGFRSSFPAIGYAGLLPYLDEVKAGSYAILLPEPPSCWVMTRGSTGRRKLIPATSTHLQQVLSCGARAVVNYALRTRDMGVLRGGVLNLNFPSVVESFGEGPQATAYGYSSGTYARLNPALNEAQLVPRQEEIDALGPGVTGPDWERRFELVYQQALKRDIAAAMGVTPVILSFARYVKKNHGRKPLELWKLHALFCTSVRKIQFRYAPGLRAYFGPVPVVEMYTATEGVYAQQLDDLPYVTPNYDKYLFEVETRGGPKMLHELRRGEWGRLIVSSCLFPRYDIGDMVEAAGKSYFRIFGRAKRLHVLEHQLYRLFLGWLL